MQGELAALAVWGVVKQLVYSKFRLQITAPKIHNFASLVPMGHNMQREVVFLGKSEGLTLMRDWPWYDKLICKQTYNRISYVNKMFFNLSVSYADSSLYQREPCYSFGLKCRFATEQVYQREPVLLKIIGLQIFNQPSRCSLNAHTTLPCTGRANFTVCWDILLQRKTILNNLQFISVGYKITFVLNQ